MSFEPHRFMTVPRPRLTKFELLIKKDVIDVKQVHAVGKVEHVRIPLEVEVRVQRRELKMKEGSDLKDGQRWTFSTELWSDDPDGWGTFDEELFPASELPKGWEKWTDEEIFGVLTFKGLGGATLSSAIDHDEAVFPSLLGGVQSAPLRSFD